MADLVFLLLTLVVVAVPFGLSRMLRLTTVLPLVVIQILLGIALGPSLLGRLAPQTFHMIFDPMTLSRLSGAAAIAVLFFAFITGLHVDADSFRGRGRAFCAIAAASIAVPTLAGFGGGLWIVARYPAEMGLRADPLHFAVAIAICVGVTALPVLAAILRETGLLGRRIGNLALGIAAVNDAALWLLLGGLMTAEADRAPDGPGILFTLAALPVYLAVIAGPLRQWLRRAVVAGLRDGAVTESGWVIVCGVAIASAIATQIMGLHYVFGAFAAGAVMPRDLRRPILDRLHVMTVVVLMPFFFMLTGLRTMIDPATPAFLEILLVTTLLAVLGKVGGTTATAWLVGESLPAALSLGALVQTKGLMEVVVLTIMLDRQIISGTVFSALTLMAVVSTALAMPLLRLALARSQRVDASARSALPARPLRSVTTMRSSS